MTDLRNYSKQHVTIEGADGVYLGRELDAVGQSIKNLNDYATALSGTVAALPAPPWALSDLATQVTGTFLGNISGSTASPSALTATQVTANLNVMVGDTGSGGTKGLVPVPAAGKQFQFLRGDATWNPCLIPANNLGDILNAATARTNLSISTVGNTGVYADLTGKPTLGTAAALDVGTTASKVVQLDGSAKLPAVDGSALTNLPAPTNIPTSSTFPVGSTLFCFNRGSNVSNNTTTSGGSLEAAYIASGVAATGSGTAQTGTWKNVTGCTVSTSDCGTFVRTA